MPILHEVRRVLLVLCALLSLLAAAPAAHAALAWPSPTLQIGLEDEEGGAAALRASAPFGVRYHYLAGGVNTGQSWQSWATAAARSCRTSSPTPRRTG